VNIPVIRRSYDYSRANESGNEECRRSADRPNNKGHQSEHFFTARRKSVRIAEPDWIVPRVRVQIDAAGQPDGILGQQDPLEK